MIVTVSFFIDGKPIGEVSSEQSNEVAALAWVAYAKKLLVLVQGRDVTDSPMLKVKD